MSPSTLLLDLFPCALCDLPSSVVVMYMCIMVTAISMQVIIIGMTEALSCVVIVIVCGCGRRGMLRAPMQGGSGGVEDVGGAGRSTGDAARRASSPRAAVPGAGWEAGASHVNAGPSGGVRATAGASESDSD